MTDAAADGPRDGELEEGSDGSPEGNIDGIFDDASIEGTVDGPEDETSDGASERGNDGELDESTDAFTDGIFD